MQKGVIMKKRLFALVSSLLLFSMFIPMYAFASNDLITSSEQALNAFARSYNTTLIPDQLARGQLEPVLQDNVSFELVGPGNAEARPLSNNSICDVRRVGSIGDIDVYQATYIANLPNLQETTEEYIDGMRVSFTALYSVRQYDGDNYNRFINSRLRVLSSSDGNYIDEFRLNFLAAGYGFADQDSTKRIFVDYVNPSDRDGPIYAGEGFVRNNNHKEYTAESPLEGTCASAPFTTSEGSEFEMEISLGLDEF